MHQIRQNARPTIRERREKREPRSKTERDDRASPHRRAVRSSNRTDERRDRRSSGAITPPSDDHAAVGQSRNSSIDDRDRRTRTARRSMSGAIVRRETSAIVDRRSRRSIDDRDRAPRRSSTRCDRRMSSAIVDRAARRRGEARSSLSLWSGLSLLSSLSLSLFPEVNWSENEGRNSFPGQRWNLWSTGNHFPENNVFRDSQTHGFSGNWFLKLVFTRFKRSPIFTNKVNR